MPIYPSQGSLSLSSLMTYLLITHSSICSIPLRYFYLSAIDKAQGSHQQGFLFRLEFDSEFSVLCSPDIGYSLRFVKACLDLFFIIINDLLYTLTMLKIFFFFQFSRFKNQSKLYFHLIKIKILPINSSVPPCLAKP